MPLRNIHNGRHEMIPTEALQMRQLPRSSTVTTAELGQEAVTVTKPDDDDLQLWSVTTIIGILDKPALLYWASEQTANAAIDHTATWQAMVEDSGREETVKWLRDARFRRPKTTLSAAELGTAVHTLCETYALTGNKPGPDFIEDIIVRAGSRQTDVVKESATASAMLEQFDKWLQRFTPTYQGTEVSVYNPEYGYAGQADAFMTIDGVRFLADYKTTRDSCDKRGKLKTPHPENVALQLAAYRHAPFAAVWRPRRVEKFRRRYYLFSPGEREMAVPVPEVDTGLVIQISPDDCSAYPVRCDEEAYRAFLFVLEAFRWVNVTSKTVMNPVLEISAASVEEFGGRCEDAPCCGCCT